MLVISIIILRSEMVPDTLSGVPEMMDTPPIQNNYVFYLNLSFLTHFIKIPFDTLQYCMLLL